MSDVIGVGWWFVRRLGAIESRRKLLRAGLSLAAVFVCYCVFFLISGVVVWLILRSVINVEPDISIAYMTSVISLSWLGGYSTLGAPGGVGVRESILIVLLQDAVTLEVAGVVAIAYRLVTILGDVWLFGLGALSWRHWRLRITESAI